MWKTMKNYKRGDSLQENPTFPPIPSHYCFYQLHLPIPASSGIPPPSIQPFGLSHSYTSPSLGLSSTNPSSQFLFSPFSLLHYLWSRVDV